MNEVWPINTFALQPQRATFFWDISREETQATAASVRLLIDGYVGKPIPLCPVALYMRWSAPPVTSGSLNHPLAHSILHGEVINKSLTIILHLLTSTAARGAVWIRAPSGCQKGPARTNNLRSICSIRLMLAKTGRGRPSWQSNKTAGGGAKENTDLEINEFLWVWLTRRSQKLCTPATVHKVLDCHIATVYSS